MNIGRAGWELKENMPPGCDALWEICRKKSLLRIDKQKKITHTKKFYMKDQKLYESDCLVGLGGLIQALKEPSTIHFHNISNTSQITLTYIHCCHTRCNRGLRSSNPWVPKAICPLNHICRVILNTLPQVERNKKKKYQQRMIGIFLSLETCAALFHASGQCHSMQGLI